jgi:hypothetical protein
MVMMMEKAVTAPVVVETFVLCWFWIRLAQNKVQAQAGGPALC